jgi:hypothetical protein
MRRVGEGCAHLVVAVFEALDQLGHVVSGEPLGKGLHFDVVGEGTTTAELHDEEHVLLVLQHLIEFDDAGVIEHHHRLRRRRVRYLCHV